MIERLLHVMLAALAILTLWTIWQLAS